MIDDDEPRKPITIAQAWSAPILICAACAAWALIARGIVGIYQRRRWQGCVAIACGVGLFAAGFRSGSTGSASCQSW